MKPVPPSSRVDERVDYECDSDHSCGIRPSECIYLLTLLVKMKELIFIL